MKIRKLAVLALALTAISVAAPACNEALAAPKKTKSSRVKKSASKTPEALRRKRTLVFDGRTSEALSPGKYDSLSQLSEGTGYASKRLYSLPKDFSNRVADQSREMRYRQ